MVKPIAKPKPFKKGKKKCRECESTEIYREGRCYEHFRILSNKRKKRYRDNNNEKVKETHRKWMEKNPGKSKEYEKNRKETFKVRKCNNCGKEYKRRNKLSGFCSMKCNGEHWKKNNIRKGKNNPAYRNGFYTNRPKKMSPSTIKHHNACREYRTAFLKENDYLYCEICKRSDSIRYETHHIVYASEAPKHKELHNFKNLIVLCIKCHNDFHGKKREIRKDIVIKRGLEKLFDRNLYDRD